jgi:hypothetical protein
MFSQHRKLAVAWEKLQLNNDTSAALREVVGQHALQNTSEDETRTSNEYYQTTVWIKTIYDLQRCYLSGTTTVALHQLLQVPSCLLPSDLLYSSVLYLISTKAKSTHSQAALKADDFTPPELMLAHTILSGLRLLLLYKDSISRQNISRLQMAINETWKGEHIRGVEGYIIKQVCSSILDLMGETGHIDAYRVERDRAQLPTYASGLVSSLYTLSNKTNLPSILLTSGLRHL